MLSIFLQKNSLSLCRVFNFNIQFIKTEPPEVKPRAARSIFSKYILEVYYSYLIKITKSAFDYKVYKSAFNDNGFDYFFSADHFRDGLVCKRDSFDFVLGSVLGNIDFGFNLAV